MRVEGGGDVLRSIDLSSHSGVVDRNIQFQLTGASDVKAAQAFIQPTGGDAHLGAVHIAMKAGEGTALAAAHQAGGQVMSPLVQMIMRMPGHLGLMSSFFEALGHFFMGQDILANLDPTALLSQHAASALHSVTSAVGEHMPVDISLLPHDAPAFMGEAAHGSLLGNAPDLSAHVDGAQSVNGSELDAVGRNALNTSGYADMGKPQFEQGFNSTLNNGTEHAFPGVTDPQKYLAWDTGASTFRPTMSGTQVPSTSVQVPQANVPVTQSPVVQSAPAAAASGGGQELGHARDAAAAGGDRGSLINGTGHQHTDAPAGQGTEATQGSEATQPGDATTDSARHEAATIEYKVQHGDNLWDIARRHMGDGSRWTEIYQLNQSVIGDNARLIHEGTTLQLPGNGNIADYTVKPGDNLWDISKEHLGGGQHWPELYHANEGVIGSNPDLIHPGQHFTVSGSGSEQLASSDIGSQSHSVSHIAHSSHSPVHAAHTHHPTHLAQAHTTGGAEHHVAQANTQSASSSQVAQANEAPAAHADHAKIAHTSDHVKIAHAPGGQPAQAGAASHSVTTSGQQVALRAQAGSLEAAAPAKFEQISGDPQ